MMSASQSSSTTQDDDRFFKERLPGGASRLWAFQEHRNGYPQQQQQQQQSTSSATSCSCSDAHTSRCSLCAPRRTAALRHGNSIDCDTCCSCSSSACSTCDDDGCSCTGSSNTFQQVERRGHRGTDDMVIPVLLTIPLRPPQVHQASYRPGKESTNGSFDPILGVCFAHPPPPLVYVNDNGGLPNSDSVGFGFPAQAGTAARHIHRADTVDAGCQHIDTVGLNAERMTTISGAGAVDTAVNTVAIDVVDAAVGGVAQASQMVDTAVNTEWQGFIEPLDVDDPSRAGKKAAGGAGPHGDHAHNETSSIPLLVASQSGAAQIGPSGSAGTSSDAIANSAFVVLQENPAQLPNSAAGQQEPNQGRNRVHEHETFRRAAIVDMEIEVMTTIFLLQAQFAGVLEAHVNTVAVIVAREVEHVRQVSSAMVAIEAEEVNHRCVYERDALDTLMSLQLAWHSDCVRSEVAAAKSAAANVNIELRKARNDSVRLENTILNLQRQLAMIRTTKVSLAAEAYCNRLQHVDGAENEPNQQPTDTAVVGGGAASAGQNVGRERINAAVHVTYASTSSRPSLLDAVDLNMPVHERFARAQRAAAEHLKAQDQH